MGALEKKPKSGDKPPIFLLKKFPEQRLSGLFGKRKPKKRSIMPSSGLEIVIFSKTDQLQKVSPRSITKISILYPTL